MQFEQLGPYRIGRQLGRGGMGTVYQGVDVDSAQPAAIKVLNPRLAVEEGFRERFETEIETLKKLKHPNIVRLYGFGEQDGHLYYAMELVPGVNLEDELQGGRRFTWRETAQLGGKLARALKHAHDHGVIHRDLKPANLLLTEDDEIKLADFGIARLFGNTRLTSDGGLIGTAEYMAPEQADGRPVTSQCDLYSLGGVLFAMLAGRPPFRGGSLPELLQYHRFAEPPLVSKFAAGVPAELERIINTLLSKDPQSRGTNALVIARQLAAMEHALSVDRGDEERGQGSGGGGQEEEDVPAPIVKTAAALPEIATAQTLPDLSQEGASAGADAAVLGTGHPTARQNPLASALIAPLKGTSAEPAVARADSRARAADDERTARGTLSHSVLAGDVTPAQPASSVARPALVSRFTTVEEDERRRAEEDRRLESGSRWVQIALLVVSLAAIVGLGFYFTRPPSADKLYDQIDAIAGDEKPGRLLDAEDDIHRFLERFPQDPRAAKLKGYVDEIVLLHLERQMQRQPRAAHDNALAPIQRDYLDAIGYVGVAPQKAIAKLKAILVLYAASRNSDETHKQFFELAQRQLKRLEEQSDREKPNGLAVIDANLRRAEQLRGSDSAAAAAIWSGIVELYSDKPWAAAAVARAKAELAAPQK